MRRSCLLVILAFAVASSAYGQAANTISTVAGGGTNTGAATGAFLPQAYSMVRDSQGNTYISAPSLNIVYKVNGSGTISAYAGTGIAGLSGDGGPATSAQIDFPTGLAIDAAGDVFITDRGNNRIRKVAASTGDITTLAGSGVEYDGAGFYGGYSGDGGLATEASMNAPLDVAVDTQGNLYIADSHNQIVRFVSAATGIITTYAGTPGVSGYTGNGGAATGAELNTPTAVTLDSSGNLYISDSNNCVIRKVDTSAQHIITVYAGTPDVCSFAGDGAAATSAQIGSAEGIYFDTAGNLLIADTFNYRIRKVDSTTQHNISTIAGTGSACTTPTGCGDGALATAALLNVPYGVYEDSSGNVFVADTGDMRVREIPAGTSPTISNFAGSGTGGDGGAATNALLGGPYLVNVDANQNLYILDSQSARLREVNTKNIISTIVGNSVLGVQGTANGDGGLATAARLIYPTGMAIDSLGNIYIVDGNAYVVRKIDTTGHISTIAGNQQQCSAPNNPNQLPSCGDGGPATSASLFYPFSVAVDSAQNVYISDAGLNTVRIVHADGGGIATFAGTAGPGNFGGDGGPPTSAFMNSPFGIAFDPSGNLYIADAGNNRIREVNTEENVITTYAFNGEPTFGGDGGSATSASMNSPQAVAFDAAGNLFVGGGFDNVVRRIDFADNSVATVAGDVDNLDGGYNGDGIPSTQALLSNFGMAVDANENLYIGDAGNDRIRKVPMVPAASWAPTSFTNFGTLLPGQIGNSQILTFTNSGLNDLTVTQQGTLPAAFSVSNFCSFEPASPLGSCTVFVEFAPPAGTAAGTVSGNLVLATNDPNNPTVTLAVSGTVVTTGFNLTVTEVLPAPGAGTVESTPSTIACPSTCSGTFASGTLVTLAAIPGTGYGFIGWSTNCAPVTNVPFECTITMSQAATVTATFGAPSLTVSSMGNGSGVITSSPPGISCPPTCTFAFPVGTQTVDLTATANAGSTFVGWSDFLCTNTTGTDCLLSPGVDFLDFEAIAVFSVPRVAFTQGDVFVGATSGLIYEYHPNGNLVQILPSLNFNSFGGYGGGMAFDCCGDLYAANPSFTTGSGVETFASNGTGPVAYGGASALSAGAVRIDSSGTGSVFIGLASNSLTGNLLEYNAGNTTSPNNFYFPAYYKSNGIFAFEIANDNATMFYTVGGTSIYSFNFQLGLQNPDLTDALPGIIAGDLRQLPDSSLLVADGDRVVRISSVTGAVLQTYQPTTFTFLLGLTLDPDGVDFWTDDSITGIVYKINISSGAITSSFNTNLAKNELFGLVGLGGMAVYGSPASGGNDLTVNVNGLGTGTVASNPSGISCLPTCTANFTVGTQVVLTATPTAGSTFAGWSGACTNTTGTCTVTMSAAEAVTATFNAAAPVTIGVDIIDNGSSGLGTVVDSTGVIDCTTTTGQGQTGTCSTSYSAGSTVTYTETPGAGSVFTGWTSTADPCQTGTAANICTITASNSGSVFGNFGNGAGTFTLTVALPSNLSNSTGSGSIGVGVTGGGISCNFSGTTTPTGTCSNSTEKSGGIVELIPIPNDSSTFGGYSGTCSNQVGNNCFVTMSQNQTVTPVFTIIQVPITETITGNGSIVDTANAGKINCSSTNGVVTGTCSANYPSGTSAILTETPGAGYTFSAFGGSFCQTSTPTTCTITAIAGNTYNETATFTVNNYLLNASTEGGSGTGTVTSNANNLNGTLACGPNNQPPSGCGLSENYNWPVTLTATASSGSTFAGWSASAVSGFTLPCTTALTCSFNMPVTLPAGLTVTATFNSTSSFALSVTDAGSGGGTVSSSPAGITCPSICTANFTNGASVTLSETPNSGSTFAGWSGSCTGTGSCVVTMSAAKSVTATFNSTTSFALGVTEAGSGSGTVSSSPAGIDCVTGSSANCSANYSAGTVVTLTATPNGGSANPPSTFAGWSGACTGTGMCVVTMSAAKSVTATFNLPTYALTATISGTGTGTLTSSPAGINCSTGSSVGCTANFTAGIVVTMTETPGSNSTFEEWSGSSCSGTTCTITMNSARSVGATFNASSYTLTVTENGTGSGTVMSESSGRIVC